MKYNALLFILFLALFLLSLNKSTKKINFSLKNLIKKKGGKNENNKETIFIITVDNFYLF